MNQTTTVAAVGTVDVDYNLATFYCQAFGRDKTVVLAKESLQNSVAKLAAVVTALKDAGLKIVKNSEQTTSSVNEEGDHRSPERKVLGYVAGYAYTFQIADLSRVSEVFDALTSLDDVTVRNPTYSLKSRDRANKKALKDAWAKVSERFETECTVLGLKVEHFEATSWETTYSDTSRNAGATVRSYSLSPMEGAVGSSAPSKARLELTVGKEKVTVNLEVRFVRKPATYPGDLNK